LKKTTPLAIPWYEDEVVIHTEICEILKKNKFRLSTLQPPTPPSTTP
jgi:hypothetical protein